MVEFYIMPDDAALEEAMQMDRTFFEQHPDKVEYCRLAIPGEDWGYFPPKTVVHVVYCGEGMRSRTFIVPPKHLWEALEAKEESG